MTSEIVPGGIYTIPYPFNDPFSSRVRPALALNLPNTYDDVSFAFITTSAPDTTEPTIELLPHHFDGEGLPFRSFLRLGETFQLGKGLVRKRLATLNQQTLAEALRKRILHGIPGFYEVAHARPAFVPGKSRISYAGRVFDAQEILTLVDASLDFWLTTGRYAQDFEKKFSSFLGVRHCSLTNSGSSANLLAFMALTSPKLGERRVRPGDEVITVAAAFPTTVAPIVQYGAIPVFVDIDLRTVNIDCTLLERALSEKTKAVMLAHTLGNPFDLKTVKEFCDKYGLWLIEDNCDALGARYFIDGQWKYTGTIGHIGTASFYPPHHITTGEGGAVVTNDTTLKRIIESFRDWGRDCWCPSGRDNTCGHRFDKQFGELPRGYDHKYVYSHFGFNLKITEMQAAIGCAQMEKLSGFIQARKRNWTLMREQISDLTDQFVLPEVTTDSDPSWFGFMLTVQENAGFSRDQMVTALEANGIQTRMLFAGNLVKHPCFDELRKTGQGYRICGALKNTDAVMQRSFWLGISPDMTPEMIEYMAQCLRRNALAHYSS